ncbi:hypothetical protein [Vibrio genomosp. F10]|nr:hypothetical protein [Vibrio genomosp. F10]
MTGNREVASCLKRMRRKLEGAINQTQIKDVVTVAQDLGYPLKYDDTFLYLLSGSSAFVGGSLLYLDLLNTGVTLPLFLLFGFLVFVPLMWTHVRRQAIAFLSDEIYLKNQVIYHGLTEESTTSAYSQGLLGSFLEFKRGNHSRRFTSVMQINNSFLEEGHFFKFEYVERRRSIGRERNSATNVVDRKFNRCGIVIPFEKSSQLAVISDGNFTYADTYQPASLVFRHHFNSSAKNVHQLAKFLTPSLVEEIVILGEELSGLNIEVNDYSQLCISCSDIDVLSVDGREFGLDNPTEFKNELGLSAGATKLNLLLTFLSKLDRN